MSSREDHGRYRGRRRLPARPRTRYAMVATTAVLGAGAVALGVAATAPSPSADFPQSAANTSAADSFSTASRAATADRADRSLDRAADPSVDDMAADLYVAPLASIERVTPFGSAGSTAAGVLLGATEGTEIHAIHSGTVTLARYYGAYGNTVVIDTGNGTSIMYAHVASLTVHEGQQVNAGDAIALAGASGYVTESGVYLEIQQGDDAIDPIAFLTTRGIDIQSGTSLTAG